MATEVNKDIILKLLWRALQLRNENKSARFFRKIREILLLRTSSGRSGRWKDSLGIFLQRELYVPCIHGGEEMNLYLMYKHNLTFVFSLPIGSRVWRWKSYTFLLSFLVSIQSWSWWSPKPLPPEMLHDLRGDPKSPRHLTNS